MPPTRETVSSIPRNASGKLKGMARPVSIDDEALIDQLSRVISQHGYEAASLQLLSEASGLKRASLYHRFPGGKPEILDAALARAEERFDEMLAPANVAGDPTRRAKQIAKEIDRYYDGGQESCLIVALSLAGPERKAKAQPCLTAWTQAFARISSDAGVGAKEARERADELVAQIEGALVISAATGNRVPFERAVARLPHRLIEMN